MRLDDREYKESRRKNRQSGFSFDDIKDYVIDHYQYFGVGILFVCLVIILSVFSSSVKDEVEKNNDEKGTKSESAYNVPDVALEVDAYPEVNALVKQYFEALATGDTQTLSEICSSLDEEEAIRIEKKAEYTEGYSNYTVYTKPGPEENSYIVFGYYEIKFKNIDTVAPGLTSLYIKTKPDGTLYVYDEELSDEESEYIKEIAAQEDVVDLLNTVDQKYTEASSSDETLKNFMDALPTALDDAVAAEKQNRENAQNAETEAAEAEADPLKNFTVKSTDNVNVRSGPSTDSEKLGQLLSGDTFTCIEAMADGWSKIDFQGSEAYVKTEFIERVNEDGTTSPIDTSSLNPPAQEGDNPEAETGGETAETATKAKVKVNETVRVRKGPSTDDDILGQAEGGSTYELLGEENGWSKIEFNGHKGYIRNDFVTKQ